MDTGKKRLKKKEKENIICVHSNWVKFSAAKNGLGKSLLRDVRYVYEMPAPCMAHAAASKQILQIQYFIFIRIKRI